MNTFHQTDIMKNILNKFYQSYLKIRFLNLKIKSNVTIDIGTKIYPWKGSIEIGKGVVLRSNPRGYHAGMSFPTCLLVDIENAFIRIGDFSRLNGVYVHAQKGITIGKGVVIAAGVNILDSNGHRINSLSRVSDRDIPKEIVIGDNVWIGLNSIILKGSIIGSNSVVGAGAIVNGVFPENSLIVGNPATKVDTIVF